MLVLMSNLPAAKTAAFSVRPTIDEELMISEPALLMEQFVRWAYNASTRGLTEDFLNQALPPTNRHGNPVSAKKIEATGRRRG